ncbi:hypothetical protein RM553_18930 [Zunongwangia sp. F363]|uniref:Uncharacterized protein n=1 Tax=Autumnicola tepida TaxID=3075595 RepID=A0ABU3CFZ5_9FLAO|nr:hypothetical protein [Zunongwangia sp. F363]MDT0644920.1 hypothetical protein [Zunongwangia sp. F363]
MKFINLFLLLIFSLFLASCDNDEPGSSLNISSNLIEMEGEGGTTEISVTGKEWSIAEVINLNGNINISGDTYSDDGEQLLVNRQLYLDSLGRMEALWSDKGFKITRTTATSLEIFLKENSTGEDFGFVIMVESGGEVKEITVKQKKSQGYTFEKIEFSLKENDGDSLYIKKGDNYKFTIPSAQEFSFSPFNGINVNKRYQFQSSEDDAFVWIKKDSVMVELPSAIHEQEIYFDGGKGLYTNFVVTGEHDFKDVMEIVTLPSGESEFSVEIEYRKRVISYTLYLINNRTNEEKKIEGKWIEHSPTGEYNVEWE